MINPIDIFFSYSHEDRNIAKELHTRFSNAGLKCFMAEKDIASSEQWADKIREAIKKSKRILILITPRSKNSHWVLLESGAAWVLKKDLIPALMFVRPEELVDPIRNYQARFVETPDQIQRLTEELSEDPKTYLLHENPHKITARQRKSFSQFSSSYLMGIQGTLATWMYLHEFDHGLRKLENNRYIFAHDTNLGHPPYKNVFSLSRGPESSYTPPKDPVWKLWLANSAGEEKRWMAKDTAGLSQGWHHFALRWDHRQPIIEFLIDGKQQISVNDYVDYWPDEYDEMAYLGSWQSLATMHFIETSVFRFIADSRYLDDSWIQEELNVFEKSDNALNNSEQS